VLHVDVHVQDHVDVDVDVGVDVDGFLFIANENKFTVRQNRFYLYIHAQYMPSIAN